MSGRRWIGVAAFAAAGIAAAVAAGMPDARAGKPGGGGGGTTAPSGTIVFLQGVRIYAPDGVSILRVERHLYATNAAGTASRSLGLVSDTHVTDSWGNRAHIYYWGTAVEVSGKLWVTGKRVWYTDANGNGTDDPGERTAWDLIAAREGGTEVTLATSATSDVGLAGGFTFLPDGDRIRGRTQRTSGADAGLWDAAISWDSGEPSIVPTNGQNFVLVLADSDVPGALHLSPDMDQVVGEDATADTLWIRTCTTSGGWSSPRTLVSGVAWTSWALLSPDGAKVLYNTQNGLRIVNADGSGDVAFLTNSSSIYYDGGVWSPDGANLAVNKRKQTTAWSNTLNWAPAKAKSTATQIGTWDFVQVGSWIP